MNHDQVSSAVSLVIGLAICLGSIHYQLGSLSSPESGLMPFLSGAAITLFSVVGLIHGTLKKRKGEIWSSIREGMQWKRAFVVLASLTGYILLLKPLGFFLCTSLFIGFLLRAVVPQRWPVVVATAIITAVVSYVVFEIWLKAQLPRGLWEFRLWRFLVTY